MARRILFFGITGIDKRQVLERFAQWCSQRKDRKCKIFDFTGDFLKPLLGESDETLQDFMDARLPDQHEKWQKAWAKFRSALGSYEQEHPDQDIFLALHGCCARSFYGVRILLRPEQAAQLEPDRVVTLLDNVYDHWWRTEARAEGEEYIGMPTLEHLLFARRIETMVADQVSQSSGRRVPHLTLAVNHPFETLWNWLYGTNPRVIYLCFPISAPRRVLANHHDSSGIKAIDEFLRAAYEWQGRTPEAVVVCPLMIDELPLVAALNAALKNGKPETIMRNRERVEALRFEREALCWNLGPIFSPDMILSPGPLPPEKRELIPYRQIQFAAGMIETDVGWRDFRLVDQANYVAAFNPRFKNQENISRSVQSEIEYAAGWRKIPVYFFQDPAYDPEKLTASLMPEAGTMGPPPEQQRIIAKESVAEVFRAIQKRWTAR